MENTKDSSDFEFECTPPAIREAAEATSLKLLPQKSKYRYEQCYNNFLEWRRIKEIKTSFSENVLLAYVDELSNKFSPPTLWSQYSMLKSTILANHNVDISKYSKLRAFLKRKSDGYQPKKAKTLSGEQVEQFLTKASDDEFLFEKVTLVLGISGACRKQELVQLSINDIKDMDSAAIVYINNTKNKVSRSFNLTGKFYDIYKKYADLRPVTEEKRFFLNYKNKRCTKQVVGVNKIGNVPKVVAKFLRLIPPELYTRHTFRRSSATILVDAGGDRVETLKRHGGWKSSSVAEGYIDESDQKRTIISNKIMGAVRSKSPIKHLPPSSFSVPNEAPSHPQEQAAQSTVVRQSSPTLTEVTNETHQIQQTQHQSVIEAWENSIHNAPVQFAHCSNNQFTFNFYNYPKKN